MGDAEAGVVILVQVLSRLSFYHSGREADALVISLPGMAQHGAVRRAGIGLAGAKQERYTVAGESEEERAMWNARKRTRFGRLREKQESGTIDATEQAELAAMVEEIENAEAAYLGPANEKLEAECARVEAQNATLQGIIQRKKELIRRLEQIFAEAR
jgi:hypothetical protein